MRIETFTYELNRSRVVQDEKIRVGFVIIRIFSVDPIVSNDEV